MTPRGQGIDAWQVLNLLECHVIAAMCFGRSQYVHTFGGAKKLALEVRAK